MPNATQPSAFHFAVSFNGAGGSIPDVGFEEVSGLESRMDQAPLVEGGENQFRHRLPAAVAAAPLTLKRARVGSESVLIAWCRACVEGGLSQPIEPKDMSVGLIGEAGQVVARWAVTAAYPVKWTISAFRALEDEVAIEAIEMAYRSVERTL